MVRKHPRYHVPSAPAVLVDYYRTGGFAGFNDRLVVFDNGVAVISGKNVNYEIDLNQSDIDRITQVFNTSQFSMLEGNYSARHAECRFDKIYHQLPW